MISPLQIDVSAPSSTPEHRLVAFLLLGFLAVLFIIMGYRARYEGLPTPLHRRKAWLLEAKADATVRTHRFPADTDWAAAATRDRLRAMLDPDAPPERAATTGREALAEVRRELAELWAPRWYRLPQPARWLLSLATNIAVLGFIAVSTDLLLRVLRVDPRPTTDPAKWAGIALRETAAVFDLAGAMLFQVPGVRTVWSILFSFSVLFFEWAYGHWYVVAAVLVVGALTLTLLEYYVRVTPGDVQVTLPPARRVARLGAVGTAIVWGAMLVGIGLGRRFHSDRAGVELGLALGAVALAGCLVLALWKVLRWATTGESRLYQFWTQQRAAKLVTIMRLFWLSVAVLVSPLLPIYGVVALTKLPVLIGAYLSAAPEIQVLWLAIVAGTLAGLGYLARDAAADVRTALREAASRKAVRTLVVGKGVPVVVVAGVYMVAYGFIQSIIIAGVVAVAAGLGARAVYVLGLRAKYQAHRFERGGAAVGRVVVEAAPLTDHQGQYHYYARVNGDTELLHPDRDALVATIADIGHDLCATGSTDPTVAEWHARFAFRLGITDIEETEQKLEEKVAKRLFHELRDNGRLLPAETVDAELDRYPPAIREQRIDREIHLGNLRWGPRYVELRNDPRAEA